MKRSATGRDAAILEAIRLRGPGTLSAVLGHTPSSLEADAVQRLWHDGKVSRTMKGVYAVIEPVVLPEPAKPSKEYSGKTAPAVLERGLSFSGEPVPGKRRKYDAGSGVYTGD